jgi:hypothetical protein
MTLPDCMMPDGAAPCEGFKSLNAELESVEKIRDVLAKTVNAQEAELERLRRIERAAQALSDEAQEYAMDFGLGCAAPNSYWEDLWEALDPDPLKDERPCTCHPDDNPPVPCPHKYALSECRAPAIFAAPVHSAEWLREAMKLADEYADEAALYQKRLDDPQSDPEMDLQQKDDTDAARAAVLADRAAAQPIGMRPKELVERVKRGEKWEVQPAAPAEPVAWQYRVAGVWVTKPSKPEWEPGIAVRPLYAAPIRDKAWIAKAMELADEYAEQSRIDGFDYPATQSENYSIKTKAARTALEVHLRKP